MNDNKEKTVSLDRRNFLKKASVISLSTIGLTCCNENDAEANDNDKPGASRILSYRRLWGSRKKVSDVSFGVQGTRDYRVVLRAINRGVNYFDTSPDYGGGRSEETLGKAIKKMSKSRDKIVVTTKLCSTWGDLSGESSSKYIKAVEDSLKRLKTDYIDYLLIHGIYGNDRGRLTESNMLSAYEKLKKAGKVRHLGVSSHSYSSLNDLNYAIDSGVYKLIMLSYYYMDSGRRLNQLNRLIKKARRKGVSFIAMKTLDGTRGIDLNKLKDKGTRAQALLKWVLGNPNVSCLVISINNMTQLNEYLQASGKKFGFKDANAIYKEAAVFENECRIGCSDCESVCPNKVHIADILRFDKYFLNYDRQKEAMLFYSQVPVTNRVVSCDNCDAPCEKACYHGISIKNKLTMAHQNLTLV